jgi:hypothetical protein
MSVSRGSGRPSEGSSAVVEVRIPPTVVPKR